MNRPLIVVTGATGRCGGALVRRLVNARCRVRALTRQPLRSAAARALRALGADVVQGDLLDPSSVRRLLLGADRACLITTPFHGFDAEIRAGLNFIEGAKKARLGYVVFQSVTYADTELPHCATKGRLEDELMRSGLAYTILRPGAFFDAPALQICRYALEGLREVSLPVVSALPHYWVAVDDIAEVATRALIRAVPSKTPYDLVSENPASLDDIARILREALGAALELTFEPKGLRTIFPNARPGDGKRLRYQADRDYYAPLNRKPLIYDPGPLIRDFGVRCAGPRRYVLRLLEDRLGGSEGLAAYRRFRRLSERVALELNKSPAPSASSRYLGGLAAIVWLQEGLGVPLSRRATALAAWQARRAASARGRFRETLSLLARHEGFSATLGELRAGRWMGATPYRCAFERHAGALAAVGAAASRAGAREQREGRELRLHRYFIGSFLTRLGLSQDEQDLLLACLLRD